jgi:hypothetical protein
MLLFFYGAIRAWQLGVLGYAPPRLPCAQSVLPLFCIERAYIARERHAQVTPRFTRNFRPYP